MQLNRSFLLNTVLSLTLLTFATLAANAKQITNYAQDHSGKSHAELTAATIADTHGSDTLTESSDHKLSSQHTNSSKLAFAILIMVVGLSYFYQCVNSQRKTREKAKGQGELPADVEKLKQEFEEILEMETPERIG